MKKLNSIKFLITILAIFIGSSITAQNDTEVAITRDLVKPPFLKKGDTIMILSPAGRIRNKSSIDAGIELANHWGLVVFFGNHMLAQDDTFAGTDKERAEDLQKALDNPSIKAIWAARGGYGSVRVIDRLDYTKFLEHPKWIIGYSDITVFHNKMHGLGVETIHGQMPLTLDLKDPIQKESIVSLYKSLFGKKLNYKIPSSKDNRLGESTGQIVGGNLTVLLSLTGSETDLDMHGKVLFIEDVGEKLYRVDRMMLTLKRAGYFKDCKGIIVGDFDVNKDDGFGKSLESIILNATKDTDFPIIFDFPAGHIDDNRAIIMGSYVDLKVTKKKSKITFR